MRFRHDLPQLASLRNLGPRSSQWLQRAGIQNRRQLRSLGAVNAYRRALIAGARPNLNLLWALQGAIQDRDWRHLSDAEKAALLMELEDGFGPRASPDERHGASGGTGPV